MQDINRIIEERRFLTFEEAAEDYDVALEDPEEIGGPIGVQVYQPPNTGFIPILIYPCGAHVIPNEGSHQSYAKEFSSEYELRMWVRNYHPTVRWFINNKGVKLCLIMGTRL